MLSAGIVTLALVASSHPTLLREIDGYQDLKFGMSAEEASKIVGPLEDCAPDPSNFSEVYCGAPSKITLLDRRTTYSLSFLNNRLYGISINVHFSGESTDERINTYRLLADAVKAKYGPPYATVKPGDKLHTEHLTGNTQWTIWWGPTNRTTIKVNAWESKKGDIHLSVEYTDAYQRGVAIEQRIQNQRDRAAQESSKL